MEKPLEYAETKAHTGLLVAYMPKNGGAVLQLLTMDGKTAAEAAFAAERLDEAHILYTEVTELLKSRTNKGEGPESIRRLAEKLFALFRGEEVHFEEQAAAAERKPSAEFPPNPGKKIDIEVDGIIYERLPVRTRVITMEDKDILPLIESYVSPYIKPGDILFVSEKALTITQGRVVSMSSIKPTPLARFLARHVGNNYGSDDFRGFGHGTALAMQLFLEETGYLRLLFAAAASAVTRPFGIKGLFYRICGLRAKSIDCPMSFLILEYAHSAKLAPNDPNSAASRIKGRLGNEVVILDANYRGAFSLGKSDRRITEDFIGKAFRDNPLGQSDEMTPFCILRRRP